MTPIYNNLICPLKLTRSDVCSILIALATIARELDTDRWHKLHERVLDQLNAFDAKHTDEHGSIILEAGE